MESSLLSSRSQVRNLVSLPLHSEAHEEYSRRARCIPPLINNAAQQRLLVRGCQYSIKLNKIPVTVYSVAIVTQMGSIKIPTWYQSEIVSCGQTSRQAQAHAAGR